MPLLQKTAQKTRAEAELARRELARRHLLDFTLYTKHDYEVNWHHRYICEVLDKFVRKEITRLIICCPPRHGKSELVSRRLPAFIFGVDPDAKIIATSYGADLAHDMNRDCQEIMDTPEYVKLFPKSALPGTYARTATYRRLRNVDTFQLADPSSSGRYVCAGVGGPITGKGANYAIIDDPIKNDVEAHSITTRARHWHWYTSTLYSRLEKNGSVLLTLTRWHDDDLAGRLIDMAEKNPVADQWTVVSFPAINEHGQTDVDQRRPGEALWPGKKSVKDLEKIRIASGSYYWNALYQQSPVPAGGSIIKEKWLQFYQSAELPVQFDDIAQSWDMRFGKSRDSGSYVVGQVWGRLAAKYFLLYQYRGRWSYTETRDAFERAASEWPAATKKLVENKANGPAIMDDLHSTIHGIIPIEPRGSKEARCHAIAPLFESGNVYIPDPSGSPWAREPINEWIRFPSAATDDQTDAMTQMLSYWLARTATVGISLPKGLSRTSPWRSN